jgi:hypothetical protein
VLAARPCAVGDALLDIAVDDNASSIAAPWKTLKRLQEQLEAQLSPAERPRSAITPKVLRRTYACTNVILHAGCSNRLRRTRS